MIHAIIVFTVIAIFFTLSIPILLIKFDMDKTYPKAIFILLFGGTIFSGLVQSVLPLVILVITGILVYVYRKKKVISDLKVFLRRYERQTLIVTVVILVIIGFMICLKPSKTKEKTLEETTTVVLNGEPEETTTEKQTTKSQTTQKQTTQKQTVKAPTTQKQTAKTQTTQKQTIEKQTTDYNKQTLTWESINLETATPPENVKITFDYGKQTFAEKQTTEDKTTEKTGTEKQTTEKQTTVIITHEIIIFTEKQTTEKQTTEKQTTQKQTTEKQTTQKQTTEKQTHLVEETTTEYPYPRAEINISYTEGASIANVIATVDKPVKMKFAVKWYNVPTNDFQVIPYDDGSYNLKINVPADTDSKLIVTAYDEKTGQEIGYSEKYIYSYEYAKAFLDFKYSEGTDVVDVYVTFDKPVRNPSFSVRWVGAQPTDEYQFQRFPDGSYILKVKCDYSYYDPKVTVTVYDENFEIGYDEFFIY